ncbi:MAG: flagellar hook basal-body protein [Planctomycetaceae bacterium]|jgi:flagellar basal-body rod protein FlgF/flagellar basal-body rod protein FlgG|nr:flagellar hook basal-body protein [Planctomycetaceae bacterium]
MSYGLYVSAEGAHAQEYRMRTIANNIANVETPGFKRELALQMARATERQDLLDDYMGSGSYNDLSGGCLTIGTHTAFNNGTIKQTNQPFDIAVEGNAWFRVRDKSNGEEFLTRAGNFGIHVDRDGGQATLVTEQGQSRFVVLTTEGEPLVIPDPNDVTIHFTDDGRLMSEGNDPAGQGGMELASLALVEPDNLRALVKVGETMFRNEAGFRDLTQIERQQLRPGHIEMSNTSPAFEISEMIVTQRTLEANVKMMHVQDEASGGLISKVLSV